MDAMLQFLQENWQWLFALGCLAFYFYDKKKGNGAPDNKIEEIGAKAEEIIKEKVDAFVNDVEEEAQKELITEPKEKEIRTKSTMSWDTFKQEKKKSGMEKIIV